MSNKYTYTKNYIAMFALTLSLIFSGCGNKQIVPDVNIEELDAPLTELVKGERDNTPLCLVPEHPGTIVYSNELVTIDASNTSEGYVCVKYTGTSSLVKLQLSCPSGSTYTYRLSGDYDVFPLSSDSGVYTLTVLENIQDTQYSTAFVQELDVTVSNVLGPYLYPNQYVNFSIENAAVNKAMELAYPANNDLEVVTRIYNYVTTHITYDTELAANVQSGYLPDIDNTLNSGKGICLDYSSLMASMLRSQQIPTHMEVGYAGTAYHAWISVYLDEVGWVNGMIEFDGTDWELMDPTFASSSDTKKLKDFIGDGSNYDTKYIY